MRIDCARNEDVLQESRGNLWRRKASVYRGKWSFGRRKFCGVTARSLNWRDLAAAFLTGGNGDHGERASHFSMFGFECLSEIIFLRVAMIGVA
jgi:hypothetical protein